MIHKKRPRFTLKELIVLYQAAIQSNGDELFNNMDEDSSRLFTSEADTHNTYSKAVNK